AALSDEVSGLRPGAARHKSEENVSGFLADDGAATEKQPNQEDLEERKNAQTASSSSANDDDEKYEEGKGKMITLGSSFFEPGQNEIDHKGKAYLKQIAGMLKDINIKRIIVTGHTDAKGDGQDFMNEAISESRAASAAQELILNGIPESKIKFKGEGSSKPLKKNKKKGQRKQTTDKQDRRVEIEIFE
ncbi:MAG: OmpA family protein, partial [Endomicrobium sp.]|nr:OmpA family protein [Endomicrobium sp.]